MAVNHGADDFQPTTALAGIREVHALIDQQGKELASAFREGLHELSEKFDKIFNVTTQMATEQATTNGDHEARIKAVEDDFRWLKVETLIKSGLAGVAGGGGIVGLLMALGVLHR